MRVEVFRTLDNFAWCLACPSCGDYWYADDWQGAMREASAHVDQHRARLCVHCGRS